MHIEVLLGKILPQYFGLKKTARTITDLLGHLYGFYEIPDLKMSRPTTFT